MNSQPMVPMSALTRESLQNVLAKIQAKKAQGATEANDAEYAHLLNILRVYQQQNQNYTATTSPAGTTVTAAAARGSAALVGGHQTTNTTATATSTTQATMAQASSPLTPEQLMALKYQILAFKHINKNLPVPSQLQQAMFTSNNNITNTNSVPAETVTSKIVEAAYNHSTSPAHLDAASAATNIGSGGGNVGAGAYNAYTDPYTYLKNLNNVAQGNFSRQQRMLVPSITPVGLDPHAIAQERENIINARMEARRKELEKLPSNLANDTLKYGSSNKDYSSTKLKALIELKSLRLVDLQRRVRHDFIKSMSKGTSLATSAERAAFRRMKKQTLREARITEKLERQQRIEKERREKQKHLDYLQSICNQGREMTQAHKAHQAKQLKLGRQILALHAQIEKEEQKRMQQTARERLQALKEDDEQKYLKLIDEAKDKRITHLLKQTNKYLESLAQAVIAQQNVELHHDPTVRGGVEMMDDEEGTSFALSDGQKIDYYDVAHRIKEEVEQPHLLDGGLLKDYQIKGLQWMVSLYNNRLNGILADEMGLGKTIQTISLITYLIERKKQNGPFLIIVPLSTLTNWTMEFEKWAPEVTKCVYKGIPAARKEIQTNFIKHNNFQVLLTTYEYIIKDKAVLSKLRWVYMIIDEGHRMKNTNSKLSTILTHSYQSRYRLILTGTPLQNNLPELWSLLNFVLPKIFDSVKSFDEWFNTPFAHTAGQDKIELNEEEKLLIIKRLHKVLRPFLLRRLKKDVESELPDKVERVIKCKFSALQTRLYNQMKKHGMLFVNTGEKGQTGIKGLNNTIMQLRKICNHPFVYEEVERDINPKKLTNNLIYRVSGKFELLDRVLRKLRATGHRVLIFFQMTAIMNIMEDFLNYRSYRYLRLDGSTKAEDRSILLKKFNDPDSPYFVFLLSTRAGGLGLNLQSADTVIIFDSDWNPHQDLQAQDRAHRIGQTKEVRILRLITQKSIEETILARAQYKLDIDGKVIQAGKFDQKSTAEEREAFLRSLLEGENDEVNDVNDDEELTDDELNEIIARNDDELRLFKEIDKQRMAEDQREWTGKGKPERLIQDNELPHVYLQDGDALLKRHEQDVEYGRGQRARNEVHYDDGLTEEQWMNALENEDEIAEVIAKNQAKKRRREERKSKKIDKTQSTEMQQQQQTFPFIKTEEEQAPVVAESSSRKKRASGPALDLPIESTTAITSSSSSAKRKGKRKAETTDDTPKQAPKKRKNTSGKAVVDTVPQEVREKLNRIFKELYEVIENCTDYEDGEARQRCFLFKELVRKQDYPQYYQLIKKPIAMKVIQRKVKNNEYSSAQEFRDDFHLMFNNAMEFNETDSQVYKDAVIMKQVFDQRYNELVNSGV
ncbi:10592_t:CDS:2 [Ambispora leptoticha]|uniref:10592_t:CDS:1 n=1 Tax=Ambispora leptoticha TaxID=144679 RepID=A0A9N9AJF1_9GLOM|nr:10592_t:CDS:2 [Ambispora leptoticha]